MNEYEQRNITAWFEFFTSMQYTQEIIIYLEETKYHYTSGIIPTDIFIYRRLSDEALKKAYYHGSLQNLAYMDFFELMDYAIDLIIPVSGVMVIGAVRNQKSYLEEDFKQAARYKGYRHTSDFFENVIPPAEKKGVTKCVNGNWKK